MTFAELGLCPPLVRALSLQEIEVPTSVQREAIPVVLSGRDAWISAQTGSGKTGAFLLPLLERWCRRGAAGERRSALILAPSRELAQQIHGQLGAFAAELGQRPKVVLAVGGVSINPQQLALRGGCDFLVATPGRLLDLERNNAARLQDVSTLVVDEADHLLRGGFAEELRSIVSRLPSERQTLLVSATFPDAVRRLVESMLRDPAALNVDVGALPSGDEVVQRAVLVDAAARTPLLRELLATHAWPQVLIFVASRYSAAHVAQKLRKTGVAAGCLHGDMSQGARTQAFEDFKHRRLRVLVATDVAARGIDVPGLAAVINYDLPRAARDYTHRLGRTGRAGECGEVLSFVTAENRAVWSLIERRHGLALDRVTFTGFEPRDPPVQVRDPHGGIKGKRKSKKDKLREAAALALEAGLAGTQRQGSECREDPEDRVGKEDREGKVPQP